ncbi:MAG: hypothetical protein HQM14_12520 [SAR324 cluster bacterium]|nr:hypothetical protein [SAR324 cluster bacterium]
MYQIAYEDQDIIIRFPKDSVSKEALSNFLDYLKLEDIRSRSTLTEERASDLANEIDQQVWGKLKNQSGGSF